MGEKVSRRDFIRKIALTGAMTCITGLSTPHRIHSQSLLKSRVFKVVDCPVHDGALRHVGVDILFQLLSTHGIKLYKTSTTHPWGDPSGIIANNDIVLIKVNCQWKCRGTTNTDVLRGVIHRILEHPDGFSGEIIIFENGQGQGSFDGNPSAWGAYNGTPVQDMVIVNAEEETVLTVEYLVNTVFSGYPVSYYLLDPISGTFITDPTDHVTDGYRTILDVSYPCFTSLGSNRINFKDGSWNGSSHINNLKFINIPVLKTHAGSGITGALKHCYGILSMQDGGYYIRHYPQIGTQCGKMYTFVKAPDLNILDCIWVSHEQLAGYPVSATVRTNTLVAGIDPVAIDYHASKHVLYPLGGFHRAEHDPDTNPELMNHLTQAQTFINDNGGINGQMTNQGDANIEVITESARVIPVVSPVVAATGLAALGYGLTRK